MVTPAGISNLSSKVRPFPSIASVKHPSNTHVPTTWALFVGTGPTPSLKFWKMLIAPAPPQARVSSPPQEKLQASSASWVAVPWMLKSQTVMCRNRRRCRAQASWRGCRRSLRQGWVVVGEATDKGPSREGIIMIGAIWSPRQLDG
ncbi:hypothetical protein BDZ97DRAFT_1842595 [Flammula alnicola]|nr:hypothetical protein BDZ97DRAFT_1842595 [Flammula alnicola]